MNEHIQAKLLTTQLPTTIQKIRELRSIETHDLLCDRYYCRIILCFHCFSSFLCGDSLLFGVCVCVFLFQIATQQVQMF